MIKTTKKFAQKLSYDISYNIDRYGIGAIALIISIELVWAASVLVPVLYLISMLISSMNSWLAILPGFWGGVTFLLFLFVAGFVACLPSTYVARLREHLTGKIAARYPAPSVVEAITAPAISLKPDLQGSD
jgi:hypothetical protein